MRRSVRELVLALLASSAASCSSTRIQTTHYLGVFDPQQQVPEELYKVTIDGNASAVSDVKYASGWVPAAEADLLVTQVKRDDQDNITITGDASVSVSVGTRRRFFEIGPSGVSTQPEDGRFVIVMGSNPDYFFRKMGLLTRFGKDDSAIASSIAALANVVREKQVAAAGQTQKALEELSKDSAGGGK